MNIETEHNIILSSNSLIMDEPDSYIIIPVEYQGKIEGKIKILFRTDDSPINGIKSKVDKDVLVLECINFNETLGRFTVEPLGIGQIMNKKLSIQLWSALTENEKKIRRVEYTIFLEK